MIGRYTPPKGRVTPRRPPRGPVTAPPPPPPPSPPPAVTVAYGACCTWWDDKRLVGSKPSGLPCCPHCGGVLFETDDASWFNQLIAFQFNHSELPTYREAVLWARGRCFPDPPAMLAAYNEVDR